MKDKPVDRDVDRMRELLARTPPADPGATGRADAVVQRVRRDRRRRGVIGGAAVALFAAAVIVTPHFLETSPTTNDATDPTNGAKVSENTDPWTTDPCPGEPIDVSGRDFVDSLPEGAESVRLCRAVLPHLLGGESKQDVLSSWEAPQGALVGSPDDFLRAVKAAPDWDPAECAAANWVSDPFALVVTYAEGATVIGAQAPICTAVTIGGRAIGSDQVVAAFVGALQAQQTSAPESAPAPPDCAALQEQKLSTFEIDQLGGPAVSGVVCYTVDPQGAQEYANDKGVLSEDQISAIESDMKSNRDASRGMCIDTGPTRVIRLADAWGNVTSWVDDRCTGDFASPTGIWSPSDDAEQVIADALGGRA